MGNDPVAAGEVCTYKTAKQLNILDDNGGFKPGYADIKLFNATDTSSDVYSLCHQSVDKTKAFTNCALSAGVGFVPAASTCMPYSCPTGFQADPAKYGSCTKPAVLAVVDQKTQCHEKWSDWFTVRNYHLGNGYTSSNATCWSPCPKYSVPGYANDPAESGAARIDMTSADNPATCINKQEYFGGKYAMTGDYCPLVWIKRVGSTPASLKKDMLEEARRSCGEQSPAYAELEQGFDAQAGTLSRELHRGLENVVNGGAAMERACQRLHTSKNLVEAYTTCQRLKNDNENFLEEWGSDLSADEKTKGAIVLEQACDQVFCRAADAATNTGGKPMLCFNNIAAVDVADAEPEKPAAAVSADQSFLRSAARSALYIIIYPVLVLIAFLIFLKLVWPHAKHFIVCQLWPWMQARRGVEYTRAGWCLIPSKTT